MNAQILIDALVQQVTVLIAQVATSGGLRAPIAHIANQVFVDLSNELEAQGVGRKVSADMFGMALRAYQRKRKRLSTRANEREHTLWAAVLEKLQHHAPLTRKGLLEHFARDDERSVRAVLRDLVDAGLVIAHGRGGRATYAVTDGERRDGTHAEHGLRELLWALVHRSGPISAAVLADRLRLPRELLARELSALASDGRVAQHGELFETHDFRVPLDSGSGWEAAVLDHVQAVVQTICQRLLLGPIVPRGPEAVGGSTFRFDVWAGHPLEAEVQASLARFRADGARLQKKVEAHNAQHGRPRRFQQVVVYGGQCAHERQSMSGTGEAQRGRRKR